MTRSGKFHLICNSPNLFPLKLLRMTWNGQFCLIYNFCNLSPPKWLRMTRNCEFHPICNFSNVFQLKWLRMTRNGQFCTICNFSNLFRLKWPRMTWNGQFHLIRNFSNLFPLKLPRMTWNGQFCMAKIKCTLIQGNFYERLPFYMDSCALSPMASLFLCSSNHYHSSLIPSFTRIPISKVQLKFMRNIKVSGDVRCLVSLFVLSHAV